MATTLVYFGNHNLQKDIYTIIFDGSRNATGVDVQTLDPARASGTTVVNNRLQAKAISLRGILKNKDTTETNIRKTLANYDLIFNTTDSTLLRLEHDYATLIPTDTVTGWAVSDDATNLALNTTDYELGGASLGFDIDVSASANDYATITYTGANQADITGFNNPSFNFSLFIKDAYFVENLEVRIGSDSSNYYETTLIGTNYEGRSITDGVNKFALLKSQMQTTGTPVDTAIDYIRIRVNYSADMEDTICRLNPVLTVEEDTIRNFPVFRTGEMTRQGLNYLNDFESFEVLFINHTGLSQSTHTYPLFTTNLTGTTTTQKFEIEGSTDMIPLFTSTINTATDVKGLEFKNLETERSIKLDLSTLEIGDNVQFGGLDFKPLRNGNPVDASEGFVPTFSPGVNRVQINVESDQLEAIPATPIAANQPLTKNVFLAGTNEVRYVSQSFTTISSGPITELYVNVSLDEIFSGAGKYAATIYILNDSSDSPGNTILWSRTINQSSPVFPRLTGLNIAVSNATKYHIVIDGQENFSGVLLKEGITEWQTDFPTAAYAGGDMRISSVEPINTSPSAVTSWSVVPDSDAVFEVIQTPAPAWDLDISANYRKLHLS